MARTLTDAQQLYSKSDTLHEQADQLHHSIHEAHLTAQRLHKEIRKAIPPAKLKGRAAAFGTEQESPAIIGPDLESRKNAKPFPIVGIGASAGGFEALQQLLAAIPADTGMGFVIVQHLDPSHESKLTELLQPSTGLAVVEIKANTDVQANRFYVMPPNVTLTLSRGRLRLSKRRSSEIPPMPVDRFFRSLAADQQDRAPCKLGAAMQPVREVSKSPPHWWFLRKSAALWLRKCDARGGRLRRATLPIPAEESGPDPLLLMSQIQAGTAAGPWNW